MFPSGKSNIRIGNVVESKVIPTGPLTWVNPFATGSYS